MMVAPTGWVVMLTAGPPITFAMAAVELLFAGEESTKLPDTVTVPETEAVVVGRTVTVKVALLPLSISPSEATTGFAPVTSPRVVVALTSEVLAGRGRLAWAWLAVPPALVIVAV